MPVSVEHMRDFLLPGLYEIHGNYDMVPRQWDKVFQGQLELEPTIPAVSFQVAAAAGLAAVVIKNPSVTRRFFGNLVKKVFYGGS